MEQYIWLIDDDAAICDSLSLLLSTVGWQTQAFDSAHAFSTSGRESSRINRLYAAGYPHAGEKPG